MSSQQFGLSAYWLLLTGYCLLLPDSEKWLTKFDGLAILNVDLDDLARRLCLNLIHQLHGFDDTDDGVRFDVTADPHKTFCIRRRRAIKGAYDWRADEMQTLIF